MEDSILVSTKKILGLTEDYTAFDLDIMTHINATFAALEQLGVGPEIPHTIESVEDKWSDIDLQHVGMLSMIKTYIYLSVRLLFDPPGTSFHLEAAKEQIKEYEWRLNHYWEVNA